MALLKIEGIITRTVKYGESSMILDLLTASGGIQSFIVGGVRTKGKKNRSAIVRVLNIVNVEAYVSNPDKISRIKEISYAHIYQSIPFDVAKGSIATFLIEVCRKVIPLSDDSNGVYHYIVKGLIYLDQVDVSMVHFHINFLIKLTQFIGIGIQANYSSQQAYFDIREGSFKSELIDHRYSLDQYDSSILYRYLSEENPEGTVRADRMMLLSRLIDYYKYHVESFGELKSYSILQQLYAD
jgi:DNA repair protein RecO